MDGTVTPTPDAHPQYERVDLDAVAGAVDVPPELRGLTMLVEHGQRAQKAVDAEIERNLRMAKAVAVALEPEVIRRALTEEAIDAALAHIQRAQDELGRACSELGKLEYGAPTGAKCGKLYDQVHAFWYRVRKLGEQKRVRVDEFHLDAELKRRAGGAR